ncbi:MAG: MurR/RpiR family transcriptional regulator [Burkholderiaceae bacterium]
MLARIRASRATLSPSEQRVADLVLADPRGFAASPVGALAERAQVSKPTVLRFCRSLGFGGLTDFKRTLAGSVNEGVPFVHRAVEEGDAPGEILVKVLDNAVASMLKLRNDAAGRAYEQAVAALDKAGRAGARIQFYGVGNSGIVAQDAQLKFFRLGVQASAVSDSHVQLISATLLTRGDCAVFISNSGRSRDILEAARLARKNQATTLAITASGSPLARLSHATDHIVLAVDHPEDHERYTPMVSRLLHLAVIDVLVTAVALRMPAAVRPRLAQIKDNLRSRREEG